MSLGQLILIEDDPAFRGILTLLFESEGWEVVEAPDGRVGLTLAMGLIPDVVVTDLRMPGMSGIELAGKLAASTHLSGVPIVAITSDASRLREAAVRSGLFLEVLTKPLVPNVLLKTVRRALPAN